MGQTSKTEFLNVTDWIPYSDLAIVFEGIITANGTGNWIELSWILHFLGIVFLISLLVFEISLIAIVQIKLSGVQYLFLPQVCQEQW
jgi:hypothetical protein